MEKSSLEDIGQQLLGDEKFISKLSKMIRGQKPAGKEEKVGLGQLIEDVRQLLQQLIRQQIQNELQDIIEDNNKILIEIKDSLSRPSAHNNIHDVEEASFSEIHKLMDEERKKINMPEEFNDASLDKSISAFVELKVETIQERVINVDRRMKSMEEKYETNLKSIWNVLSITEGAIFDHLKDSKSKGKSCMELQKSTMSEEPEQKKSFFGFFKSSK